MPIPLAAGLAIAGGSALANALFGRPKTSTTTNKIDQTTNSQNQTTGTTSNQSNSSFASQRAIDPQIAKTRNSLFDVLMGRLNPDTGFLRNYAGTGISNINKGYDARKRAITSNLASRGLAYSPGAAYSLADADSARIGEGVDFLNQMPLLAEQIQRQRLQDATGFVASAPFGTSTTGTETRDTTGQFTTDQTGTNRVHGTTTGTGTTPNTAASAGIGGLMEMLAFLAGSGQLNTGGGNQGYATGNVLIPG